MPRRGSNLMFNVYLEGREVVISQFTRYRTFRPLVYHGREKRHIQESLGQVAHFIIITYVTSLITLLFLERSRGWVINLLHFEQQIIYPGLTVTKVLRLLNILELCLTWINVSLSSRDLLTDNYFEKFHSNGEPVTLKSNKESILKSLCHYQGKIRNLPDSWVALSTCAGLR